YQIIAAAGVNGGARLKYRDISLTADDMQLDLQSLEFRGRRVKLKMGKLVKEFSELYWKLNAHEGYGITTFLGKRTNEIVTQGVGIAFIQQDKTGKLSIPADEERFG